MQSVTVLLPATQACYQITLLIVRLPFRVSKALNSYLELPLLCPMYRKASAPGLMDGDSVRGRGSMMLSSVTQKSIQRSKNRKKQNKFLPPLIPTCSHSGMDLCMGFSWYTKKNPTLLCKCQMPPHLRGSHLQGLCLPHKI